MVASIEDIIGALNRDTHLRVENDVGAELSLALRLYELRIRTNGSIGDPQTFTNNIKGAINKVLAKYVTITTADGGITALTASITNDIYARYFGFNETESEQRMSNIRINNYDDFAHDFIQASRQAVVASLVRYGQQGVEGYLQGENPALKTTFFDETAKYFPRLDTNKGFFWTNHARTESMDVGSITQIVSAAVSGTINPRMARDMPRLLEYRT